MQLTCVCTYIHINNIMLTCINAYSNHWKSYVHVCIRKYVYPRNDYTCKCIYTMYMYIAKWVYVYAYYMYMHVCCAQVLGVRQGDLDLHGRRRLRTWTRLGQTARANTTTITLSQAVDWRQGDRIVIAATGKDGNETEENEIVSASSDGVTLTLSEKLRFEHLGITEHFEGGHSIELRAEVGLLSHNVIVEGSRRGTEGVGGLGEDQYGVQIMIHRIGPYSTPIRIEHTEVRFAGQAFRLGRYAIHFHLTGSMIGSYIRNCAIHHSNNRALTAHGVHDLLIEGNVAYDIKGHTFFVVRGIRG